jgi:hypothetical protein
LCPHHLPPVPRFASLSLFQNPKVTADRQFNGFGTNFEGNPEPIYGPLFLPRKFKVAVTGGLALPWCLGIWGCCLVKGRTLW